MDDVDDFGVWDRALAAGALRLLIIAEPAAVVSTGIGDVLLLSRRSRVGSRRVCRTPDVRSS